MGQVCAPLIGDLNCFFHGGGDGKKGTCVLELHDHDWDSRRLMVVKHNIADLDKWTDQLMELCLNYC